MPRTIQAACVIPAAGSGTRFGGDTPKQFLPLDGISVLRRSLLGAAAVPEIEAIVIAAPPGLLERARSEAQGIDKVAAVVEGGATRVHSVGNALDALDAAPDIVVVHDAARPLASPSLFSAVIARAREVGGAVAAVRIDDTVKRASSTGEILETVPREGLWRIQTPQAFRAELLLRAHRDARANGWEATDDAALVERAGGSVRVVEGDASNFKITTQEDFRMASRALAGETSRIGFGRDKHPLIAGRPYRMGGVEIDCDVGPVGHSDGDALCHAIADAILGAAACGDLGGLFPDDRDETKGIPGLAVLAGALGAAAGKGFRLQSIDATVWTKRPKLSPHVPAMRSAIATSLGLEEGAVSVKAKSGNGIDAVGRGEAVEAEAVVLLSR